MKHLTTCYRVHKLSPFGYTFVKGVKHADN